MSDVECPYCGEGQEICHDDGEGYEEGTFHQQQCGCEKTFCYTTSMLLMYESSKAPCQNGGEHAWEPTSTTPKRCTRMRCKYCDEERPLTADERLDLGVDL